ncbi:MAG: MarC family protein [Dehalococcoidales bacterium]|nr:MarC family protein [Dehalococcoidales bacterium]
MQIWQSFVLTFLPLLIAIDALGNIPFIVSLSEGMSLHERRRMINVATVTAAIVGLAFLFFGQFILKVLNITPGSFAIAGGIILLVLSIRYMTTGHFVEAIKEEMAAVVPIGTPLTVGPATITTLLLLTPIYPLYIILISFAVNIALNWVIFMLSSHIVNFMGQGGVKGISKVFSLLLAAIAVSMILRGLVLLDILKTAS